MFTSKAFLNKICPFLEDIISKQQYLFIKSFSMQQGVLTLLKRSKNAADKVKGFGALPTNLSKIVECLNHALLITKPALRSIHND